MVILLVEDSEILRELTVAFLDELGHQTVALESAEEGLDILGERAFDVLITDVSLPGISGLAFAKETMRRWPKLPVIVSSGYGDITAATLKTELGECRALTKPYTLDQLSAAIREATSTHR